LISGSIARRYAKALLAIGIEKKTYEKLGSELEQVAQLMKHKELRDTLDNPSLLHSKRKAVMKELAQRLGLSEVIRSFLLLLLDRNRIDATSSIAREYQLLADEHAGRIRADVASAKTLDMDSIARLKRALEQKTRKQIILQQRTDPELIAGMVTKIGSIIYDGSIRTKLEQMRQTLLEGE
jgi:F-type H+-transporting ATPase subunit delta